MSSHSRLSILVTFIVVWTLVSLYPVQGWWESCTHRARQVSFFQPASQCKVSCTPRVGHDAILQACQHVDLASWHKENRNVSICEKFASQRTRCVNSLNWRPWIRNCRCLLCRMIFKLRLCFQSLTPPGAPDGSGTITRSSIMKASPTGQAKWGPHTTGSDAERNRLIGPRSFLQR